MNEGWATTTGIVVALGLGCLIVVLMFLGTLLALFASVAWTLTRSR